jgi:predicted component of type VI protein secretion system
MGDIARQDDFDPKSITRAVDQHQADLLLLKNELNGLKDKELDKKICQALTDSVSIQEKIASIVWKTIKEKAVWIFLTLLAFLLTDLIKEILGALVRKL